MSLKLSYLENTILEENNKNLDLKYLHLLKNIKFKSYFILGVNRSGTSILYKMLNLTNAFNPVTTYHIINCDRILYNFENNQQEKAEQKINEFLKEHGQVNRGIDKLKISADFPEEYFFAFYKKNYKHFITDENLSLLSQICKKIQYTSQNKKPILLKSGYELDNFLFIKNKLPKTKFIFINRHPIKIINSMIHATNKSLEDRNVYRAMLSKKYRLATSNPIFLNLVRFYFDTYIPIKNQIKKLAEYTNSFLENIDKLDKKDYFILKYEELCKSPQKNIEDIMNFLNIKDYKKVNFSDLISPRNLKIDPKVVKLKKVIFNEMSDYFDYFGYEKEIPKK